MWRMGWNGEQLARAALGTSMGPAHTVVSINNDDIMKCSVPSGMRTTINLRHRNESTAVFFAVDGNDDNLGRVRPSSSQQPGSPSSGRSLGVARL